MRRWILLISLFLIALSPVLADSTIKEDKTTIQSLLIRDSDVFATTRDGMYRALKSDKKWEKLTLAKDMFLPGRFAEVPSNSKDVYYISYSPTTKDQSGKSQRFCGLFKSSDDGKTWQLMTSDYQFSSVFLHPNGLLYAISTKIETSGPESNDFDPIGYPDHWHKKMEYKVILSKDQGKTWSNTADSLPEHYLLPWIMIDPEHPELICLFTGPNGMFAFNFHTLTRLHAKDEICSEWRKEDVDYYQQMNMLFFGPEGCIGNAQANKMMFANLDNYFKYDFNRSECYLYKYYPYVEPREAKLFTLSADKTHYVFNTSEKKEIRVTVNSPMPDQHFTLIDTVSGKQMWRIKISDPKGNNIQSPSTFDPDRRDVIEKVREEKDFITNQLSLDNPYTRTLNLSDMGDFSQRGEYKVQIIYDSYFPAKPDNGELSIVLPSYVFTVTIE